MLLVAALMLSASAQDTGWQYEVHPAFHPPFDNLLLPWPTGTVESVNVSECWRDEAPPFYGSEWRYWCYTVPATHQAAADAVDAAFTDAGANVASTSGAGAYTRTGWVEYGTRWEPHDNTSRTRYWIFNYDGQTLIGLATDGWGS